MACLYIVATPIGNLADITYRAIEILNQVDVIFAEDTRNSIKLLNHYGIKNRLQSLHEHNEAEQSQRIVSLLKDEQSIALISDAGTPLISDPGFRLVQTVSQAGFQIVPIPGASAIITALSAAGISTERFSFEGFLSAKKSTRRKQIEALQHDVQTMVFYESSHRIAACIEDMRTTFGDERQVVLAKELTKLYETFFRGNLQALSHWLNEKKERTKGEFVVIISGYKQAETETSDLQNMLTLMKILNQQLPVKQCAAMASQYSGIPKNQLYKLFLAS